MLLLWYWDFWRLTPVAWVTNQLYSLRDLEIQSILIPVWLIIVFDLAYLSASTKDSYIMGACRIRTGNPYWSVGTYINYNFIGNPSPVVLVRVPFAARIGSKFMCFKMNTDDGPQILSLQLQVKWSKYIFFSFKDWSLNKTSLMVSLQSSSQCVHLPAMMCSVSYSLSQHNIIIMRLTFFWFCLFSWLGRLFKIAATALGPTLKWDTKCCILSFSATFCLEKPAIWSPHDITDPASNMQSSVFVLIVVWLALFLSSFSAIVNLNSNSLIFWACFLMTSSRCFTCDVPLLIVVSLIVGCVSGYSGGGNSKLQGAVGNRQWPLLLSPLSLLSNRYWTGKFLLSLINEMEAADCPSPFAWCWTNSNVYLLLLFFKPAFFKPAWIHSTHSDKDTYPLTTSQAHPRATHLSSPMSNGRQS